MKIALQQTLAMPDRWTCCRVPHRFRKRLLPAQMQAGDQFAPDVWQARQMIAHKALMRDFTSYSAAPSSSRIWTSVACCLHAIEARHSAFCEALMRNCGL